MSSERNTAATRGGRPTHEMRIKRGDNKGIWHKAGVGWANHAKGYIRWKLDPGIVLSWNDDLLILTVVSDDDAAVDTSLEIPF